MKDFLARLLSIVAPLQSIADSLHELLRLYRLDLQQRGVRVEIDTRPLQPATFMVGTKDEKDLEELDDFAHGRHRGSLIYGNNYPNEY